MRPADRARGFAVLLLSMFLLVELSPEACAQRGRAGGSAARGGARPSLGKVGGGGVRPNATRPSTNPGLPNPAARPANPKPTARPAGNGNARPSIQKPSLGNAGQRPSVQKPSPTEPSRPSLGGSRPSLGGVGAKPKPGSPTTLPGKVPGNTRPAPSSPVKPSVRPPVTKPSLNRPSTGLPSVTRPVPLPGTSTGPNGNRPSLGNVRPKPLPGDVDRPVTLPGLANRPATRPGFGSNTRPLPGLNTKPALPNRPDSGIGSTDRPVIGGLRPNIGNDTNINIGQLGNNVIVNRPGWDIVDPGFSRPSWGLNDDWHHHWYDNGIHHHHHGWYNGCWHGHWDSDWYAPLAWGAVFWGLDAITSSWSTTPVYYNPYYAEPVVAQAIPYNYSQPVIINNNVSSAGGEGGDAEAQADSASDQGLKAFDSGLVAFRSGAYQEALSHLNLALKQIPGDPVVHEVRSLALFATGDYKGSAAGLNSLLASAPGMDWTTMSGLYGNADDYTTQLRTLEGFCKANPADASAHFVLAYHYLVMDATEEAVAALRVVVDNQPKDVTARRMLEALAPEKPESPAESETPSVTPPSPAANDVSASTTDLVGVWTAKAGESQIELSITEDSLFTWKATTSGRTPVELSGNLSGDADNIELITADQGTMGGTVESKGADSWTLRLAGAPKSDQGLLFIRAK